MVKPIVMAAAGVALLFSASTAHADHGTISSPGAHIHYTFEAEPHIALPLSRVYDHGTIGLGFRGTWTVIDNGFISTISNSVGLGLGGELFVGDYAHLWIPMYMQWNFWFSDHWSGFVEPGLAVSTGHLYIDPILSIGGRYLVSQKAAVTMRLGYPALTIGGSFFF